MSQHGRCRLTWFEDGAARQTDARARITCPPVKLASTAIELPRFNPPSIAAFTCLSSKLPFCASTSPGSLFSWTIKTSEQPAPRVEMDLDAGDSPWGGKPAVNHCFRSLEGGYFSLTRYADVPSQSSTNHLAPKVPDTEENGMPHCPPVPSIQGPSSPTAGASAAGHTAPQATLSSPRSPIRRGRTPRKISAQATKLEAVDDTSDPLGPLGDKSFNQEAPAPPQKEPFGGENVRPASSTSQSSGGLIGSINLEADGSQLKGPPPVQPPSGTEGPKRQTQPSVSVEQAAKPTFEITVGDPHKVGDLTSSHIVYQVRTKVNGSRNAAEPKFRDS